MDKGRRGETPLETLTTQRAEMTDPPLTPDHRPRLQVTILYTTHRGTLAALKTASRLGVNLATCPKVLWLYAVPYTLPLEEPAVPTGLLEEQMGALAREFPAEIMAQIYLCREPRRSLRQILRPHSLIVIGGKRRWWPSKEQRMAWMLRKDGHEVIFVESR